MKKAIQPFVELLQSRLIPEILEHTFVQVRPRPQYLTHVNGSPWGNKPRNTVSSCRRELRKKLRGALSHKFTCTSRDYWGSDEAKMGAEEAPGVFRIDYAPPVKIEGLRPPSGPLFYRPTYYTDWDKLALLTRALDRVIKDLEDRGIVEYRICNYERAQAESIA